MLNSLTLAIVVAAWALLAGALFPAFVAYSILFLRRHGHRFKTVLRLCGRLVLAFVVFAVLQTLIQELMLGGAEKLNSVFEQYGFAFAMGANIGFWGSIAALVIGARRARRRHAMQLQ